MRSKQAAVHAGLSLIAATLLVAACSTPNIGNQPTHTIVQQCPAIAPTLQCPAWAEGMPTTVVELQEAWLRGREAHSACESVNKIWLDSWEACGMQVR